MSVVHTDSQQVGYAGATCGRKYQCFYGKSRETSVPYVATRYFISPGVVFKPYILYTTTTVLYTYYITHIIPHAYTTPICYGPKQRGKNTAVFRYSRYRMVTRSQAVAIG